MFDGKIKKVVDRVADRIIAHARDLSEHARSMDGIERQLTLVRIQTLLDVATILSKEAANDEET